MLRSEGTASFACLECHQLHLSPKIGYQRNPRNVGMTLLFAILTKNASLIKKLRYIFRALIRNNYKYASSARGHELSGRVRAHA